MPRYQPVGDRALLVEFEKKISQEVNARVHSLNETLLQEKLDGVEETVPTYCSLLIYFDPLKTSYEYLVYILQDLQAENFRNVRTQRRTVTIPVVYGGSYGPDLDYIAKHNNLTEKEVIYIHSKKTYTVYMIGFLAGFPYLGEVPEEIATPRLKTPRLKVSAGSVGIADRQTGLYPCDSPGGWRILGWTPLTIFKPSRNPPALLNPGDQVHFKPITQGDLETLHRK
ncbi:MAG: 5-oxoprolinase subunit PxpB [Candidatus Bathyarchaeota archaeon]|nr:MAG: 5-oxoprolinase subunit PxpB [Candidatus Bathyarchaeota archaeon]